MVRSTALAIAAAAAWNVRPAAAQVPVELYTSLDPIPQVVDDVELRSWSLFLICEPDWVLERDSQRLWELYWTFLELGEALGPEHAAVWFWTRDPGTPGSGEIHTAIDVVRSRAYCSVLGEEALPSESPHLLITTRYPGPGFVSDIPGTVLPPEELAVVHLGGRDADELEALMEEVVDRVYAGDIQALDPESEGFWRAWQSVFESLQTGIAEGARALSFTIRSGFFEIGVG